MLANKSSMNSYGCEERKKTAQSSSYHLMFKMSKYLPQISAEEFRRNVKSMSRKLKSLVWWLLVRSMNMANRNLNTFAVKKESNNKLASAIYKQACSPYSWVATATTTITKLKKNGQTHTQRELTHSTHKAAIRNSIVWMIFIYLIHFVPFHFVFVCFCFSFCEYI